MYQFRSRPRRHRYYYYKTNVMLRQSKTLQTTTTSNDVYTIGKITKSLLLLYTLLAVIGYYYDTILFLSAKSLFEKANK